MWKFEKVLGFISSARSQTDLKDFLIGLTTPYERRIFSKRIEIVERLLLGQTHLRIAKELGVGISTVSRGSRELQRGHFRIMRKSKV